MANRSWDLSGRHWPAIIGGLGFFSGWSNNRKMSSQGVGLLEFVCDSDLSGLCIHTSTLSTLFLLSPSPAVEFELGHRVCLRWHCFSSSGSGGRFKHAGQRGNILGRKQAW